MRDAIFLTITDNQTSELMALEMLRNKTVCMHVYRTENFVSILSMESLY